MRLRHDITVADEDRETRGFLRPGLGNGEEIIRTIALSTTLHGRRILENIEISIRRGEVFVILGPSGCGKTTLLRHLCGLQAPSRGSVFVGGRDIHELRGKARKQLLLSTGLSFQGGALLGNLSVVENVALPLRENTDLDEELILQVARMKLEMVDLLDAADLPPGSLSGGMRKRAAIARAIALDPDIVFLDEPSAGLDPVTAVGVDNLITKLNKVFGITMVVVTHDLASASSIADRALLLMGGHVLAIGDKEVLWSHPDPGVQDFLARRTPQGAAAKNDVTDLLTL